MAYAEPMVPPIQVRVDKIVAGGAGLARMEDGRVVFVPSVLADEVVEIELAETRRDFASANLVRVVQPSPHRREPPCPHVASGCGGCDWQHIERRIQGQAKLSVVVEAYARTAKLTVQPQLRRLSEHARRTTVRMAGDASGGLGFRRHDSHEVVPVDSCMVAHDLINRFVERPILDGPGEVSIRVGARTGETALWCHEGRLVPDLPAGVHTGPKARITERVGDHEFQVSMGSFFQSSPEAAELIIDSVSRRMDTVGARGGRLVDAYGGIGLFSVAFADRFDDLVVVESSEYACRDAVRNLADHAAVIEQSTVEHWEPCDARTVIADPARQGLGKHGVATIVETGASTVVLVSCDPVAGARDARLLVDAGYSMGEVEVLDIFPETHHVEVVAAFSR